MGRTFLSDKASSFQKTIWLRSPSALLGYEAVVALGTKPLPTVRECFSMLGSTLCTQFPTADDARLFGPTAGHELVAGIVLDCEIETDATFLTIDEDVYRFPIAANPGELT